MLTTVPDEQLYTHADRVAGKVVLITGGASGIGRQAALDFVKHRAKVVIGDLDIDSAQNLSDTIIRSGGQAIAFKCDVTLWEDQLELFQSAFKAYGSVDIVVASAGVAEMGQFTTIELNENGLPTKPNLRTVDINLTGTLYTARLAIHYLGLNREEKDSLKAFILLGSIASWQALSGMPTYSASKHGVLGLMRSLYRTFSPLKIRIASIHPFFVRTAIIPPHMMKALEGYRIVPIERVTGTIFYAATDSDEKSNGCAWVLDDDGPVVQILKEEFKIGLYRKMDERRQDRFEKTIKL